MTVFSPSCPQGLDQRAVVRFPLQPLLALYPPTWEPGTRGPKMISPERQLARAADVSERTVWRRQRTGLCVWAADRWACALGLHPSAVWRELWWSTVDEAVTAPA
ncbi:MAG: hypothetical protein ACYDH6_08680 [Acidimicrobiales bacterium]